MHILLAILGGVGGLALLLLRLQMISEAGKGLAETAGDAKGLFRRWKWRRKLNTDLLAAIDDPREAASIMMTAIASQNGVLSDRAQTKILKLMMAHFDASGDQAAELLAVGRFHSKDMGDLTSFLRRLTPPIDKNLAPKERTELLDMLKTIAAADGTADDIALSAIENLRGHFSKL